jgi:predicted lysophospholipase L1 biosynthesis ABC-type transport system permease subunit
LFSKHDLELSWHVVLDPQSFTAANLETFQTRLVELETRLADFQPPIRMETGIIGILRKFQVQFETIRLPVYILIAEIMLLVLYYVSMIAELSIRQMEREFATMYSRGISPQQITRAHLLEVLVILAITFFSGPWLGACLVRILSWVGPLSSLTQPSRMFNLGRDAWIAAGLGTLTCLAGLLLPLGPALRRSIIGYQQITTRDNRPPGGALLSGCICSVHRSDLIVEAQSIRRYACRRAGQRSDRLAVAALATGIVHWRRHTPFTSVSLPA